MLTTFITFLISSRMFFISRVLYFLYVVSFLSFFFAFYFCFMDTMSSLTSLRILVIVLYLFLKKILLPVWLHFLQVSSFLPVCLFAFWLWSMSFFDIWWRLKFMSGAPASWLWALRERIWFVKCGLYCRSVLAGMYLWENPWHQ